MANPQGQCPPPDYPVHAPGMHPTKAFVNRSKCSVKECTELLEAEKIKVSPGIFADMALRLNGVDSVALFRKFHRLVTHGGRRNMHIGKLIKSHS